MSQVVFDGDPLSEYHREHEEIAHLEEEVATESTAEVKARSPRENPFASYNREYQSLIHAFLTTSKLPNLNRIYAIFKHGFPSLILASTISSFFFQKAALLLLPISAYFSTFLHSLNMSSLNRFLSSSREFDNYVRLVMKKSAASGGVNLLTRIIASRHTNILIADLSLILDRALVLLSGKESNETEIRIKLKSIKQSRFLILGEILVMLDPCKDWSRFEWNTNGYAMRARLDRLSHEFKKMTEEKIPRIPGPVFKKENAGVSAIVLLDNQIEVIKARLYKCWEGLKDFGDVSGIGVGIEGEIEGLLIDYRVFESVHLSVNNGEDGERSTGVRNVDLGMQKVEELAANETIDCDWFKVDTLDNVDPSSDPDELMFEGHSSEQENDEPTITRQERIEKRKKVLEQQIEAKKRAMVGVNLVAELRQRQSSRKK